MPTQTHLRHTPGMYRNKSGGEFHIHFPNRPPLIIPNQFTIYGMQSVVKAAFWGESSSWKMGLCAHVPADNIVLTAIGEPTLGVDGYARQAVPLNKQHWPVLGNVNGETYIESKVVAFTPDPNAEWIPQVNRLFLTDDTQVVAVSSAIPGGMQTIATELKTSYRLYFR